MKQPALEINLVPTQTVLLVHTHTSVKGKVEMR
jgi:hypothetical protein